MQGHSVAELISSCNPTARSVVQVMFWFESKAGQNILVKPTKVIESCAE